MPSGLMAAGIRAFLPGLECLVLGAPPQNQPARPVCLFHAHTEAPHCAGLAAPLSPSQGPWPSGSRPLPAARPPRTRVVTRGSPQGAAVREAGKRGLHGTGSRLASPRDPAGSGSPAPQAQLLLPRGRGMGEMAPVSVLWGGMPAAPTALRAIWGHSPGPPGAPLSTCWSLLQRVTSSPPHLVFCGPRRLFAGTRWEAAGSQRSLRPPPLAP